MEAKCVEKGGQALHQDEDTKRKRGEHSKNHVDSKRTYVAVYAQRHSEHHCPQHVGKLWKIL